MEAAGQQEHIVLAAPSSIKIESWSMKDDPPAYIQQVITDVMSHHEIDRRRIYVFGFSAGAHYTIKLCLAFPDSFAACGSAMGALDEKLFPSLDNLHGKVPLVLFTGSDDTIVPAQAVLSTYKALRERGYEVKLQNYPGQDHNYYRLSGEINKKTWEF